MGVLDLEIFTDFVIYKTYGICSTKYSFVHVLDHEKAF